MDNSLLVVRGINHKYIVVGGMRLDCAISVGNTHVVLGIKKGNKIIKIQRYPTKDFFLQKEIKFQIEQFFNNINIKEIGHIYLASVVPEVTRCVLSIAERIVKKKVLLVTLSSFAKLNFDFHNYKKNEVGIDRIITAYFVSQKYMRPAVVIDFGTATTINVIGGSGEFLGGLIFPGAFLWTSSLYKNTSQLKKNNTKIESLTSCIGKSTKQCISSGLLYGNSAIIDNIITRISAEIGDLQSTIVTGGNAPYILPYCQTEDIIFKKELLLEGLFLVGQCLSEKGELQ